MTAMIGLAIVGGLVILAAARTVTSQDLVRSVLWLGAAMAATAVLFAMLGASFLAGVQLLLYTGGVITLMLFGIMLTRRHSDLRIPNDQSRIGVGAIVSMTFFGLMAGAILGTDLPDQPPQILDTKTLGQAFLTQHLLAFEVLSLLLLAVMIGAIVLGRKRDHLAPPGRKLPSTRPGAPR